jgi:hypothetical protein
VSMRLEAIIAAQMRDVILPAGEVIVHAQHIVAVGQKAFTQMGAQEAGAAGHQDPLAGQWHTLVSTLFRSRDDSAEMPDAILAML